jgi:hypothetical protein
MPIEVTINSLSGASPYDIYLCDDPITICVYIDTITLTPYNFEVPSILSDQDNFTLKMVDNNGCETNQILTP